MKLISPAFSNGELVPVRFTCDGEDIHPTLSISDVPRETKSLVLIVDDPDATRGVAWDHWVVWNIDPAVHEIPEGTVPSGAMEGMTSFRACRYGGPCPPKGASAHRYMFKLYALDIILSMEERSEKSDIEAAMQGHILVDALLVGIFAR